MTGYLTVKRDEVFSMLDLQWDFDEAKVAWFKQGEKKVERINYLKIYALSWNLSMCL